MCILVHDPIHACTCVLNSTDCVLTLRAVGAWGEGRRMAIRNPNLNVELVTRAPDANLPKEEAMPPLRSMFALEVWSSRTTY